MARLAAVVAVALVLPVVAVVAAVVTSGADAGPPASSTSRAAAAPLDPDAVAADVVARYRTAEHAPEMFAAVPCYCGCEEFLGHRHLLDCFVRPDGAGWEAHAAGCGVCLGEADTVAAVLADGGTAMDARRTVVQRFGGTPPTTPTTLEEAA